MKLVICIINHENGICLCNSYAYDFGVQRYIFMFKARDMFASSFISWDPLP